MTLSDSSVRFTSDRNDLDKKLRNRGYDKLSKVVRCERSCKTQSLRMFTCALAYYSEHRLAVIVKSDYTTQIASPAGPGVQLPMSRAINRTQKYRASFKGPV